MPQLNQPYTYLGEYTQLAILFVSILTVVCFYLAPITLATRVSARVLSAGKSPLEQFSVPFTTGANASGLIVNVIQSTGFTTMVGIYGILTLTTLSL